MNLPAGLVDDPMHATLARLAECLCKELAAAGGPRLCYCGLWVGSQPPPLGIADCTDGNECGVAWVRLVSGYPSATFPVPDQTGVTTCATPMAYEVEIGVARCAPRPEGRSLFPDEQAMFNAQRLYMSDMRAAARAVKCCLPKEAKKDGVNVLVSLGLWTPLENAGGKSGGSWQAFVGRA